jgi:hypothetical protein
MKILIFIFLILTPLLIKADEPRSRDSFASPNGKYIFRYSQGSRNEQKWLLIERATKQVLYELVGQFSPLTVLVSNDGKNIVTSRRQTA